MVGWVRIFAIALAAVCLTGCDVDRGVNVSEPDSWPVTSTQSSAPATPLTKPTTNSTMRTARPPATPTTNGTMRPATPSTRPCRGSDLAAAGDSRGREHDFAPVGGSVGDPPRWRLASDIRLTNRSSSTCTLTGWVDLTMVGEDIICDRSHPDGRCPDHTTRRDLKITRVNLGPIKLFIVRPGEYVPFSVLWTASFSMECAGGPFWDPYLAEIRVPGDQTAILLRPVRLLPCEGDLGITALGVVA